MLRYPNYNYLDSVEIYEKQIGTYGTVVGIWYLKYVNKVLRIIKSRKILMVINVHKYLQHDNNLNVIANNKEPKKNKF